MFQKGVSQCQGMVKWPETGLLDGETERHDLMALESHLYPSGRTRTRQWYESGSGQAASWPHLGVVAGEDFECDGCNKLSNKVQPLLLVVDLLHVNVICGDTLVTSCDTPVLKDHTDQQRAIPCTISKHSTW